ncbi:AAA family ATPase [Chitinophaga sp. HK235]|uniref:AAA family ATPase n=1 Tax=Chitinophaga sp. HK235 TaxID=2952571 RepID=UPI001BA969C0|nr:AAA family ATPase [Chitinophaga sp. HK235]
MPVTDFTKELAALIKARFPIIYVVTWEEKRFVDTVKAMLQDTSLFNKPRSVWEWTVVDGYVRNNRIEKGDVKTPMRALEFADELEEDGVLILKDMYAQLANPNCEQNIIRKLKDLVWRIKEGNWLKTVIITGHDKFIPDALQKEILIKEFSLPTADEIQRVLLNLVEQNKQNQRLRFDLNSNNAVARLCEAACGLTLNEAENAFALSMVNDGVLNINDISTIAEEKKQIIHRNGLLEFSMPKLKMEDIGGLENLKKWLEKRSDSWSEQARKYNIPAPRGVLITGLPGCGKSLTAKTVSTSWNVPLLRLDMGAVFSGLVGSSERNMRTVIQTAESMAPCVLWIDEIEKAFSGVGSSGDSGTATRLFGTFLTWMQEKEKFVFVVATANNIDFLPPELMRKGRFDEIFFVDLPTRAERKIIIDIHLKKRLNHPDVIGNQKLDDSFIDPLVERTEGFTGAEIEQVVISGLFEAFSENRSIAMGDFITAIENTVPLVVTQSEKIRAIREWANVRAVSATSVSHKVPNNQSVNNDPKKPDEEASRGGRSIEF